MCLISFEFFKKLINNYYKYNNYFLVDSKKTDKQNQTNINMFNDDLTNDYDIIDDYKNDTVIININ